MVRGNNTYTGGTTIDAGSSGSLWSGNNDQGSITGDVVDNGVLIFGAAQDFTGAISGSGGVLVLCNAGSDVVTLSGQNTYSGGTAIGTGTLQVGSDTALGSGALCISGGTLDLNGHSIQVGIFSGAGGTVTDNSSTAGTSTLTTSTSACAGYYGVICDGRRSQARVPRHRGRGHGPSRQQHVHGRDNHRRR